MRIKSPRIEETKHAVNVKVEVSLDNHPQNVPRELWFSTPVEFRDFICDDMSPYLVALLFVAMKTGEDIYLEGKLSSKLKYNLQSFQEYYSFWYPEKLKVVNIYPDEETTEVSKVEENVACCFSGGVDSFYSLMHHLPNETKNKSYEVKYGLFANGFDILLGSDDYTYKEVSGAYSKMLMKEYGIKLITVSSNLRHLVDPFFNWEQTHGAALASLGLLFSGKLSKLIIPSSDGYDTLIDGHGSHPITDPLLGTEKLEIIHHALAVSRYDKVKELASFKNAHDHLRVCWVKPDGIRNCGECPKCVQVMLFLEEMDALDQFSTFPKLRVEQIKNYKIHHRDTFFYQFAQDYVSILNQRGKQELADALQSAIDAGQGLDLFRNK